MGRVWSVDAVDKNKFTSYYGNLVALDESPVRAGVLYAGSDDGLIHVSPDGGETWRRIDKVKGVPEMTYVRALVASVHDEATVYAAFDNHKNGDFKPYLLKSTDRGKSWRSIAGDLPERGQVHTVAEDHVEPNLLFAGTEFGLFFTRDGGRKWVQLKGGLPVIAVRDLAVQRRESDLVVGTFGRGIYVLDDYAPLRHVSEDRLAEEAFLFPVKDAWMCHPSSPLGGDGKANQGDSFFVADNPPVGAVFTYHLEDALKTARERRLEREKKAREDGEDVLYPDWETLRSEDREPKPAIILTVRDDAGEVVRRLTGPTAAGIHRVTWDLRHPAPNPASVKPFERRYPWSQAPTGPMAAPGRYTVELSKEVGGELSPLGGRQAIVLTPLNNATLAAADREALVAFQRDTARMRRAVLGAIRALGEAEDRVQHLRVAIADTPNAAPELRARLATLERTARELKRELQGDDTVSSRAEPTPPSLSARVSRLVNGAWWSTSAPTRTHRDNYALAAELLPDFLDRLRELVEVDLVRLERAVEAAEGPWTPGRVPTWQPSR